MAKLDKVFILDTNIILEDASNIFKISQQGKNLIVLPETVIDEIDVKKSGFDEINFQAREFGRILSEATVLKTTPINTFESHATITSLDVQGTLVDIVSLKEYHVKDSDKAVVNDRKIIEVAQFANNHYNVKDTTLLSNDVMCRIRAISLNVKTQGLSKNKDVADVQFIRKIENCDPLQLASMNHRSITEYVPDHRPDNFCYHFVATNGLEILAYVINDRISIISETHFDGLSVKPLNVGQKFAAAGMLDERTDICVIEALAGSGKTLLAVSTGIKLVEDGQFDKIVYIRNSVESVDKAEEVGFLPGLESKFMIYNYPLLDTLEFIAKNDKKGTKIEGLDKMDEIEKIRALQMKYKIETMWPGAARGRSLSNCYVIIDEVQNFSKKSLQTVITRFDKDCKVICIGSNRQIDHPYLNKYTNGLNKVLKSTKERNEDIVMFGTELEKCVRGKLTAWAEDVFED